MLFMTLKIWLDLILSNTLRAGFCLLIDSFYFHAAIINNVLPRVLTVALQWYLVISEFMSDTCAFSVLTDQNV